MALATSLIVACGPRDARASGEPGFKDRGERPVDTTPFSLALPTTTEGPSTSPSTASTIAPPPTTTSTTTTSTLPPPPPTIGAVPYVPTTDQVCAVSADLFRGMRRVEELERQGASVSYSTARLVSTFTAAARGLDAVSDPTIAEAARGLADMLRGGISSLDHVTSYPQLHMLGANVLMPPNATAKSHIQAVLGRIKLDCPGLLAAFG